MADGSKTVLPWVVAEIGVMVPNRSEMLIVERLGLRRELTTAVSNMVR